MPYPKEATVKSYNNIDCWRTWFIEECDNNLLFGVTEKYLPLINTDHFHPYRLGMLIYLEDAPFFKKTKQHRICGPYQVVESHHDRNRKVIRAENGKIIIYKELKPGNGPWLDKSSVTRTIEGIRFRHKQLASEFDFYPYRFSIKPAKNYMKFTVPHTSFICDLCFED